MSRLCMLAHSAIRDCGPGKCIVIDQSSACICDAGFAPDFGAQEVCQPVNVCVSVPSLCKNGATCTPLPNDSSMFRCECLEGFKGKRCEARIDPCDRQPCLNNAICMWYDQTAPVYKCICPAGFEGTHCEDKRSYGLGGVGFPVTGVTLVLLWILWVLATLTAAYCCVMAILELCKNRFFGAIRKVREKVGSHEK